MEASRLGVKSELQMLAYTTSTCEIQASSVTYTTAHGNTGTLTHWVVRPGIKPVLMDTNYNGLIHSGNSHVNFPDCHNLSHKASTFSFLIINLNQSSQDFKTFCISVSPTFPPWLHLSLLIAFCSIYRHSWAFLIPPYGLCKLKPYLNDFFHLAQCFVYCVYLLSKWENKENFF